MDSHIIKLAEMTYYKKNDIKLKNLHNFLNLPIHWQPSWTPFRITKNTNLVTNISVPLLCL